MRIRFLRTCLCVVLLCLGLQSCISQPAAKNQATKVSSNASPLLLPVPMVKIPAARFPLFVDYKGKGPPEMYMDVDSFMIGTYEITQAQFSAVMGNHSYNFSGEARPAERISWFDAVIFCNRLSLREGLSPAYSLNGSRDPGTWGPVPENEAQAKAWTSITCDWSAKGYRLPTDMEWRAAANGSYHGPFVGDTNNFLIEFAGDPNIGVDGDDPTINGWVPANALKSPETSLGAGTQIVGTKPANEFGVHDLNGNVSEWVWDWVTGNGYQNGLYQENGNYRGPNYNNGKRILHGGSWANGPAFAGNGGWNPWVRNFDGGFRVARSL